MKPVKTTSKLHHISQGRQTQLFKLRLGKRGDTSQPLNKVAQRTACEVIGRSGNIKIKEGEAISDLDTSM